MLKGVILAAGRGTRLFPMTKVIPKILLPVYDKPMIFYSIEAMIKMGVKDIMIVTSKDTDYMVRGTIESEFPSVNIQYRIREVARGNADAFKAAIDFIEGHNSVLMFSDNILIGDDMKSAFKEGINNLKKGYSSIFTYKVNDPKRFGVAEVDEDKNVIGLEEKPEHPKTNLAAIGLYMYTPDVIEKLDKIKQSSRGEYEITDVNNMYLNEKKLKAITFKDSVEWFDTGTPDAIIDASIRVRERVKKK